MRIGIVLAVLALALAVAWFASEQRYDNCIGKAVAEYPIGTAGLTAKEKQDAEVLDSWIQDPTADKAAAKRIRDRPQQRRREALGDCSRLPF